MVRNGVFDDVDIATSWHKAAFTGVNNPISLACNELNFHFSGHAAHAAASPYLDRSALNVVELMNVVQVKATVCYLIRSHTLPRPRVKDLQHAAAAVNQQALSARVEGLNLNDKTHADPVMAPFGAMLATDVAMGMRKRETRLKAPFDAAITTDTHDGVIRPLSQKWSKIDLTPDLPRSGVQVHYGA